MTERLIAGERVKKQSSRENRGSSDLVDLRFSGFPCHSAPTLALAEYPPALAEKRKSMAYKK